MQSSKVCIHITINLELSGGCEDEPLSDVADRYLMIILIGVGVELSYWLTAEAMPGLVLVDR